MSSHISAPGPRGTRGNELTGTAGQDRIHRGRSRRALGQGLRGRLTRLRVPPVAAATLLLSALMPALPAAAQIDPDGTGTAVVTIDEPPPGPEPRNIRVVPGDGKLTVSWSVSPRDGVDDSEIRHALRWSQAPGVWANPRDPRAVGPSEGLSVPGGVTSYVIEGLENGVATGVFVRSFTGTYHHEDAPSSSRWVRVKGLHTTPVAEVPGPVSGLEVAATFDSVKVSWQAPQSGVAPDGYLVHLRRQGGGGETRRTGAHRTTVTFRGLNSGSTYRVWVRPRNGAAKGERVHDSVTLPEALPGPVSGLELTAAARGVAVSWQAPPRGGAPDGYIVHARPEGGATGSGRTKTAKAKRATVTFDNLEAGRTYRVWVRAVNEAGKSERVSDSITLPEALSPPEDGPGRAQTRDDPRDSPPQDPPSLENPPPQDPPQENPPLDQDGGQPVDARLDQSRRPPLVSNFGQERRRRSVWSDIPTNGFVLAQGFTTGGAAAEMGSVEVSIGVPLNVAHIATVRAELWSAAAGGGPGSKLVDLIVPDRMEQGYVAFAAPFGTVLSANTTYHFVLYTTGQVDLQLGSTWSKDEDAAGRDGWSLADTGHYILAQTPQGGTWKQELSWGLIAISINAPDPDDP